MEGLAISQQYTPLFGLSFSLEDGTVPILAEVGGAITAFGSSAGNDTPIPANAMGRFFLTDDGQLSGLFSPALILDFQVPIDSFAGCIVDIDFGEQFIIHARDEFDQIILADTITDGDPGTGDGLLSCWGFNLPGCIGAIHSIRFAGFRTQSGAFGLGLDSFSFCYSGLNLAPPNIINASCVDQGSIELFSTTVERYEYSIDGVTYTDDGLFDGLDPGLYEIFVVDSDGCETSVIVRIDPPPDRDLITEPISTSCAEDNGEVRLILDPDIEATYSLDGGLTLQDENTFSNMSPGNYTITVIDSLDCVYTQDIIIEPSVIPIIESTITSIDSCNDSRGSIMINGINGTGVSGPLQFSINNNDYTENNNFLNLSTGNYSVYLKDSLGCIVGDSVFIDSTPEITVRSIDVIAPDCFDNNGTIEVEAAGGTGPLEYEINGNTQLDSIIDNLPHGTYELVIADELGCIYTRSIIIEAPTCPIYIPNVITPNFDGSEDIFQASTNIDYEVGIIDYRIYDRWGELVFISGLYSIHTQEIEYWWDGYFKGKPAEPGVYVYMIEVRHPNDSTELFAGDVTLLR